MECFLISAVKENEKNKERKSKDYGRSKSKKKKKKKKRTKPGKALFSSVEENGFIILFCLLPDSTFLRVGIADKCFFCSDFIRWLILNCDGQDNLFPG